jgi:hypothetical protein
VMEKDEESFIHIELTLLTLRFTEDSAKQ